jgi:hypothetical protein
MMANATGSTGTFDAQQPGNTLGGVSSGIGLGALSSGPDATNNFSVDASNDLVLPVIGTGPITGAGSSASNLGGMVLEPLQMVAGSGYVDGRYRVQSAGGGMPNGTASVEFAVVGGVIVWSRIHRPGSGFTSAPTFTVAQAVEFTTGATISGGTGATLTATIGATGSKPTSMVVPATNKPFRRVVAIGAVAIDAAVSPGTYLNKSGRALVAGDELWAVGP